jgi:hypothetical protein
MSTTGIELGARNEKSDRHQVAMLNEMNSEQATAERFSSTTVAKSFGGTRDDLSLTGMSELSASCRST